MIILLVVCKVGTFISTFCPFYKGTVINYVPYKWHNLIYHSISGRFCLNSVWYCTRESFLFFMNSNLHCGCIWRESQPAFWGVHFMGTIPTDYACFLRTWQPSLCSTCSHWSLLGFTFDLEIWVVPVHSDHSINVHVVHKEHQLNNHSSQVIVKPWTLGHQSNKQSHHHGEACHQQWIPEFI